VTCCVRAIQFDVSGTGTVPMSLLDRAFVKAYTRSHSQAPEPKDEQERLHAESSAQTSIVPDLAALMTPVQDAVAWGELSDITYFRVDVGHAQSPRSNVRAASVPVTEKSLASSVVSAPAPASHVEAVGQNVEATRASEARIPGTSGFHGLHRAPSRGNDLNANRSVMSHTLTAYDEATMDAHSDLAPTQVRIDEPHTKQIWTPPAIEEPQEHFRPRRNAEESAEFARAKMESLARENIKAADPQIATFAPKVTHTAFRAPASQVTTETESQPIHQPTVATRRKAFEPLWEVDAFDFSDTIVELFGDAKLMKSIGVPLDAAVANGLRSILITSVCRGAGRTSVAIGIAVSAAAAGLRVALVDADTRNAGIADALRLEVAAGWPTAIQNGLPLDEVAIRSIEDQFTVIPTKVDSLINPTKPAAFDYLVNRLRDVFDLVIIDGSAWCDDTSLSQTQMVDAAIMVVDARNRDKAQEAEMQNDLRRAGVAGLGIVENFA
jgi:Mrp family chromosome partitioning ATPase